MEFDKEFKNFVSNFLNYGLYYMGSNLQNLFFCWRFSHLMNVFGRFRSLKFGTVLFIDI